ncbi:MAG: ribose-5-phosphate isomerase RpiA [Zoogloeaceae bacterium]|jgi:ribose 5-phosphate isomerase A|nr:ribose-5-phosphate isomerase RpiA [Zoogloeaceae bacterium]
MSQNEQKQAVARAAADYVARHLPEGAILGVGTGSTANFFIDALAALRGRLGGAVASSEATRRRLEAIGVPTLDLNAVERLAIYVDGADEIDPQLRMIKGGGGALTREKIVAAASDVFVCIADDSKRVERLGRFPLPIEVIPMAARQIGRQLAALGGEAELRQGFVTDNGNPILDVRHLVIDDPVALETALNQMPGVVACGLFALRPADVLMRA